MFSEGLPGIRSANSTKSLNTKYPSYLACLSRQINPQIAELIGLFEKPLEIHYLEK